jgi:aminoglycoside 3-N-acetyltransferase
MILKILDQAGIKKGDHLVVHSSLRKIGDIDGGANAIIDALVETVGKEGTIAMPSFCYTTGIPQPYFDPNSTPGRTGALTELFRKRPETIRSLNPIHSVVAQGNRAEEFLADHLLTESLGLDSPLDRIALAGGYVLLIGVTQIANSTIHIGEAHAKIKKFFWKEGNLPKAKVLMSTGELYEYQVDSSGSCYKAFNAIDSPMREKKLIADLDIGNAPAYLMKGIDIINITVEVIHRIPDFLFCTNLECRRCILGRQFALTHR